MKKRLNYFDYLTEKEEKNIQRSQRYFSKELEISKEVLEMLYATFEAIMNSYSKEWSYSKKAVLFLLPRLIMSTKTTLELLTRGYYFDYTVVQRSALESIALLMLLSEDEEAAEKWLNLKEVQLPKWKLIHQIFRSPTKKMLRLVDKTYADLSHFVHSSFIAIAHEWLAHLARRRKVLDFPRFNKAIIRRELCSSAGLLTIAVLIDVFEKELEEGFRKKALNLIKREVSRWIVNGLLEEHEELHKTNLEETARNNRHNYTASQS